MSQTPWRRAKSPDQTSPVRQRALQRPWRELQNISKIHGRGNGEDPELSRARITEVTEYENRVPRTVREKGQVRVANQAKKRSVIDRTGPLEPLSLSKPDGTSGVNDKPVTVTTAVYTLVQAIFCLIMAFRSGVNIIKMQLEIVEYGLIHDLAVRKHEAEQVHDNDGQSEEGYKSLLGTSRCLSVITEPKDMKSAHRRVASAASAPTAPTMEHIGILREDSDQGAARAPVKIILPDVASYPKLAFDGSEVTAWLAGLKRVLDQHGLSEAQKIREIPYWTKSGDVEERVRVLVQGKVNWESAVTALKNRYRASDSKQNASTLSRLQALEGRGMITDPDELGFYCVDHQGLANRLRRERGDGFASDRELVRGLIRRIDGDTILKILARKHPEANVDDMLEFPYQEAVQLIIGWADRRMGINSHTLLTNTAPFSRASDQSTSIAQRGEGLRLENRVQARDYTRQVRVEPSEPMDELSERMRALEIQLATMGRSTATSTGQEEAMSRAVAPESRARIEYSDLSAQLNLLAAEVNMMRTREPSQERSGPYKDLEDRYGGQRRNYSDRSGDVCYFCGVDGHRSTECSVRREVKRDGFVGYDPDEREYFVINEKDRNKDRRVPNSVMYRGRDERIPILKKVSQWVVEKREEFDPRTVKLGAYYLLKHWNIPTRGIFLTPEGMPTTSNGGQVSTDQKDKTSQMNLGQVRGPGGEDFFSTGVETLKWAEPVQTSDHGMVTEILQASVDGTEMPDQGLIEILMAKRARQDAMSSSREKRPRLEESQETDTQTSNDNATQDKDVPTPKDKQIASDREASQFWKRKIVENLRKDFKVSWEDCVKYSKEFGEAFAHVLEDGVNRMDQEHETIYVDNNTLSNDQTENATKPKSADMNLVELYERTLVEKSPVGDVTILSAQLTDFICPLLRIEVIIGPMGDEPPIVGIVDTGAQTSAIHRSLVVQRGIAMRKTGVTVQGYTEVTGPRKTFDGVIETKVWLAKRSLPLPIYVIADELTAQPLLLGMNFIVGSRMSFYFEGDRVIGHMMFGPSLIITPLGTIRRDRPIVEGRAIRPEN